MKHSNLNQPRKTVIALAIAASIGGTTLPNTALSDTYIWGDMEGNDPASTVACGNSPKSTSIIFTMLDLAGSALPNSSITTKGANQFRTPTCGT